MDFTFVATLSADRIWVPVLSGKCVAYLRRSDRLYGRLNESEQRAAIEKMIRPGYAKIVAEFVESEPLTAHWRPDHGAVLVFGQIERMRSGVHWLGYVQERGVKFRGADAPHINHLSYHQLVVSDLHWRQDLGRKVRKALASTRASGKMLGGDRGCTDGLLLGPTESAKARRERADQRDLRIHHEISLIQHRGVTAFSRIAIRLNQMGISAPRGGKWSAAQVSRVIGKFPGKACD